MATPEILPQQPMPEAQHVPQNPEIPQELEQQTGVQPVQQDPQALQDSQGRIVAQPVNTAPVHPVQNAPLVNVPAQSQEQLSQMSQGDPSDTSTWFGVEWLRAVKSAILQGKQVIFGSPTQ